MKIVVLSPKDHFHAPIVLRELCQKRPQDKIAVVMTPKFSNRKPVLEQIRGIVRVSGWDYLISMLMASLWFRLKNFVERISGMNFPARQFLSMDEVIRHFRLEHYFILNINLPSTVELIRGLAPDLIVSNLFNEIVKEPVLEIPRLGCLNIHTSPLPAYRGMAPNFWALANGETEFGTSIHFMTPVIDNGDVVRQKKIVILESDTVFSFYRRCSVGAAEMLPEAISELEKGRRDFTKQDEFKASYFSRITKEGFCALRKRGRKFF